MKKIITCLFVIGFLFSNTPQVFAVDPDTTAPVITLNGASTISIEIGGTYTDQGATALDDIDGDISGTILVVNPVDTNTIGTYTVTYNVSDTALNPALEVVRTVNVIAIPEETLLIRNGSTVIFDGVVSLGASGAVTITDNLGGTHTVNSRSVLGFLYSASLMPSSNFTLSDIQYFSSFGSLYLKCLTETGGTPACDNWQFVVDNVTPWTSMDATILTGGEHVSLYFGTPHQVIFDTTTINPGGSFMATAQNYNYLDNTWSALTGVTIGATQPNPSDPWNPNVIASSIVDSNGQATFTLTELGTYNVGIAEDYYFPTYPVNVVPVSGGGSGGGGSSPVFSIPNAISYLTNTQSPDGSFFGADLYGDWVALALGATNTTGTIRTKLLSYFNSHNEIYSVVTDNERHAMALLALGQNPYSFGGKNFVGPIISAFDGTQIGDASLVNDDIFGIIVLSKTGYIASDEIISKTVQYILSKQNVNGSWENSVDMTGAGIQALANFSGVSGVSSAITNAVNYLKSNQTASGGWSNISSSAWATGAMNAVGENWTNGGKSPNDYFNNNQESDGGVKPSSDTAENRAWATSYAIPAVLGKSWSSILVGVSKPANSGSGTNTETKTEEKKPDTEKKIEEEKKVEEPNPEEKMIEEVIVSKPELQVVEKAVVSGVQSQNTDEKEIENLDLLASAIGASTNSDNSNSKTIPIILFSASGMIVLFVIARKFI